MPGNGAEVNVDPLFALFFDQAVDAATVLKHLEIRTTSPKDTAMNTRLELCTVEDYEARHGNAAASIETSYIKELKSKTHTAKEGHWLSFCLKGGSMLPFQHRYHASLPSGLPSAEGPNVTTEDQSFEFTTPNEMKLSYGRCTWPGRGIAPWFTLHFSNPLSEATLAQLNEKETELSDWLAVTPALPDLAFISAHNATVTLQATLSNEGTYSFAAEGEIFAVYGQKLAPCKQSIDVQNREANVMLNQNQMVIADPFLPPSAWVCRFLVTNLKKVWVRILQVHPRKYNSFTNDWKHKLNYGKKVYDEEVAIENFAQNVPIEFNVPIQPHLEHKQLGLGHVIVAVSPPHDWLEHNKWRYCNFTAAGWVQCTKMGLNSFSHSEGIYAWVTSLVDGSPVEGALVDWGSWLPSGSIIGRNLHHKTDEHGLAKVTKPLLTLRNYHTLIVTKGKATAFISDTGSGSASPSHHLHYVFDDRGLYRPKEEVNIKGWLRYLDLSKKITSELCMPKVKKLDWSVMDARYCQLGKGTVELNNNGGFHATFLLPDDLNLGQCVFQFTAKKIYLSHTFRVEEYRRPEFEVKTFINYGPHIMSEGLMLATLQATYYSGGSFADSTVVWTANTQATNYRPAGVDRQFTFWPLNGTTSTELSTSAILKGKTDATGEHKIRISCDGTDLNYQTLSASSSYVLHPSALYVGIRSAKSFVKHSEESQIEVKVVSTIDGNLLEGVRVFIKELSVFGPNGEQTEVCQEHELLSSNDKDTLSSIQFKPPKGVGGKFLIRAIVIDDMGRRNTAEVEIYAEGQPLFATPEILPMTRMVECSSLTVIPDKQEYEVGEDCTLFFNAGNTYTMSIPIKAEHVPGIHLEIVLVGTEPRNLRRVKLLLSSKAKKKKGKKEKTKAAGEAEDDLSMGQPSIANTRLHVSVSSMIYNLRMNLNPDRAHARPGEVAAVSVTVKDHRDVGVANA
ncbi:Single-stranded DNA-binding protein [Balamuthia mandrillaris]